MMQKKNMFRRFCNKKMCNFDVYVSFGLIPVPRLINVYADII